jgi:hypothetical protein
MKAAFGLKAHSGWAALVVLGHEAGELRVLDRRRIELVEEDSPWAKAPYHAALELRPAQARSLVERGIQIARQSSIRELQAALERALADGHRVVACAVLTAAPMPEWSVDEIRAVHFRMHQAEGVLFRESLARATRECGVRLVAIEEKTLSEHAQATLAVPASTLSKTVATLGKSIGAPWGRDQKDAALAALVALQPNLS